MMDAYPDQSTSIVPVSPVTHNLSWVTPRTLIGIFGGLALVVTLYIVGRGSNTTNEVTKIGPPIEEKPAINQVNQAILENQKKSLADLKTTTEMRIALDTEWILVNRAKDILDYANKRLSTNTANNPCFRSPKLHNCTIIPFINEQQIRYADAMAARQWAKAMEAQLEIRAARLAADGIVKPSDPFDPSVTRGAIINENEARRLIVEQSDNVIADQLYK